MALRHCPEGPPLGPRVSPQDPPLSQPSKVEYSALVTGATWLSGWPGWQALPKVTWGRYQACLETRPLDSYPKFCPHHGILGKDSAPAKTVSLCTQTLSGGRNPPWPPSTPLPVPVRHEGVQPRRHTTLVELFLSLPARSGQHPPDFPGLCSEAGTLDSPAPKDKITHPCAQCRKAPGPWGGANWHFPRSAGLTLARRGTLSAEASWPRSSMPLGQRGGQRPDAAPSFLTDSSHPR
ncbi:hypothetical protein P7K49_012168 [Saguinus oedipus]|uniref:Uncharacterized protein n=1 Tax=Saguinus oedipus TaxID=9490 RepID=A0ABQ9VSP2_SAGOE|nr:hypothetical protein P7K49_012168 [Saguinus oedipus]